MERTIKRAVRQTGKFVKKRLTDKIEQVRQLFNTTKRHTDARDLLARVGDQRIGAMKIVRTPVPSLLLAALNIVSFNQFKQRMQAADFDKLYHLALWVSIDGEQYSLEKNERVSLSRAQNRKGDESIHVNTPPDITLNEMFSKTIQTMGEDAFWNYSAKNNNCQHFLLAIARTCGFSNGAVDSFIKQEVSQLFDSTTRKIAQTVTERVQ